MEREHPSITFLKSLYKNCDQGFINLRFLPSAKNFFIPLTEIKTIPSILDDSSRPKCLFWSSNTGEWRWHETGDHPNPGFMVRLRPGFIS